MFAIAFDLTIAETERHHPKGVAQAYADIGNTLNRFKFRRIQGSVYVCDTERFGKSLRRNLCTQGFNVAASLSSRSSRVPH